jgi:FKBP-type peptidyl-prolyl cis-trans isomerase SlyD
MGVIAEIHDEHVHMDFNHPLAGQSLIFSGTIVGVRDGSEQEIALGEVQE